MTRTTWTITFSGCPSKRWLTRKQFRKQMRQWTRLLFKLTPEQLAEFLS